MGDTALADSSGKDAVGRILADVNPGWVPIGGPTSVGVSSDLYLAKNAFSFKPRSNQIASIIQLTRRVIQLREDKIRIEPCLVVGIVERLG